MRPAIRRRAVMIGVVLVVIAASLLAGYVFAGQASVAPAGTASTESTAASEDGTRAAETSLQAFFVAWASKDAAAADSFIRPDYRGGTWEFEKLDKVEFGPITESPEDVGAYMHGGAGSASGVERSDVRAFRASITYFYRSGSSGAAPDGRAMDYVWFLERLPSGEWQVNDWGY